MISRRSGPSGSISASALRSLIRFFQFLHGRYRTLVFNVMLAPSVASEPDLDRVRGGFRSGSYSCLPRGRGWKTGASQERDDQGIVPHRARRSSLLVALINVSALNRVLWCCIVM